MEAPKATLRRVATAGLRFRGFRTPALRLAAARQRDLVINYHRVAPEGPQWFEVVPTVPTSLLRAHLEGLMEVLDIVTLRELVDDHPRGSRPRIAITFDDDYRSHYEHVLPVLRELGVSATFFLSGRSLHGLGAYWWSRLEGLIRRDGLAAVNDSLGTTAQTPAELAARIEGTHLAKELETASAKGIDQPLSSIELRALADAGMEVGFHTIQHPVLVGLGADEVDHHLTAGRAELAEAAGRYVAFFAYPHGKATYRIARSAEAAGFDAAFVGGGMPLRPGLDRYLLGRHGTGSRLAGAEDFVAGAALRLSRPGPTLRQ